MGYRNGQPVAEEVLRTAGKPARIVATCDADTLRADGLDLAYIDYVVLDKDGNVCPVNDLKLSFTVKGCGTNAGVANANMLSDEPWQADSRSAYQGRAQLIIRSKAQPGTIKVTAKAKGMKAVVTEIVVK